MVELTQPAYVTILARNFLPRALALSQSLLEHGDGRPLNVFLTDATPETELPEVEGVRWMYPAMLDAGERAILELAASYDLVEFATAVKPLVLRSLLEEHEQVAYLDPDTYAVSRMAELSPALDAGAGLVLTPHYLHPVPPQSEFSEGHLLHAGVYNLGFCAVDRRASDFLDWWWGHLRYECIHDPMDGLFVDQKWVDVGGVLFGGRRLEHHGYNVSFVNLHERPVGRDADGYVIEGTGDRLRLYHFHAFDPKQPEALTTRVALADPAASPEALQVLAREYAAVVLEKDALLGPQPHYVYDHDTEGERIPRRLRRAYLAATRAEPGAVPSPFVAVEAAVWKRWRRRARRVVRRQIVSNIAKGVRLALPEEYVNLKRRYPRLMSRLGGRVVERTGMWK